MPGSIKLRFATPIYIILFFLSISLVFGKNNDWNIPGANDNSRYDSIDIKIVRKYAPALHFHPKEGKHCCFPSSAEDAYPRARIGKTGEYRFPKELNENAPCYYEAFHTLRGFRIKYWFWYNYNDYPSGPKFLGCHPGDWEYMEIYFDKGKPYQYNFSNHNGTRNKNLNEVKIINNHVQVWCGMGSHANYEAPRPLNISSVLGFSDKVADGGSVWHTENNLVNVMNTNFGKDKYVGDWGDGKKIYCPVSRADE
jgi:hypothetical protein